MENKKKRRGRTVLLAGLAVCLIPVLQAYVQSLQHRAQQEELIGIVTEASVQYAVQADSGPQETVLSVLSGQADSGPQETVLSVLSGQADSGPQETAASLLTEQTDNTPQETVVSVLPEQAETETGIETGEENSQTENHPAILAGYAGLYEENKDLTGWLSIEGMRIDYPVMRNTDDTYYLHHDFYGKDSKYGCLYVKEKADPDAGTNFIIYGHNMKDGSMFGDLDLYLKEDFYKAHPAISFDTLYEERTYEIIAVFRSQVYRADDEVFKYYQFYQADTQEEFDYFYENIRELSLYDTGVEAEFGDTFLTLSTCAYHVADGRLVVVAKRTK